MASSIRLSNSGAPETPPLGYARIYVEEFDGVLYLKMKRPDGSVQVFGTVDQVIPAAKGGTGLTDTPDVGQFLIGTGTGYRIGDIVAGNGISIVKTETTFEISATSRAVDSISNIDINMPAEFLVEKNTENNQHSFNVTKVNQIKNTVYAADDNGQPVFRFLQVEDIPDLPIEKITNLVETIRQNSLLLPTDTDDIAHSYDSETKVLTSTIKPTTVTPGSYGTIDKVAVVTVKADGRIESAETVEISIESSRITDFVEKTQDVVGTLITNSDSVNAEYNDFDNTLKLNINSEFLITTNISDSENTKAPTSQAIKTYVDEVVAGEQYLREAEDNEINLKLIEIQNSIRTGAETQTQALNETISNFNDDIQTLTNNLLAEQETRADNDATTLQAAKDYTDTAITGLVDSAPDLLNTLKEISQAIGNDKDFATTIANNFSNINTQLSAEIENRQTANDNIIEQINAERASTTTTLSDLSNDINAEKTRAETAEGELQSSINGLQANLAQEILNRSSEDSTLQTNINTESSARQTADTELQNNIDTEKTRAEGVEQELQTSVNTITANLASEISNRQSSDETLQSNIDTVSTDLSTEITNREAAVTSEKNRADAEEARLAGLISTETSERQTQDQALQTNINTVNSRVDTEIADRQQAIATEISARSTADSTLQSNIDAEKTRAEGIESELDTKITDEATRATDKERQLQTNIDAEKTRAEGVEAQLTTDLTTEETRATAAENKLTTDLAQEVIDRTAAISQEVTDRNAAIQTAVTQSIIPRENEVYDLGSPEFKFRSLYVSGNTIYIGDTALSSSSGAISLPDGSTINDRLIASQNYVDDSVSAEAALRETRDSEITTELNQEVSRATTAETELETAISNEATARTEADSTLTQSLNQEIQDRIDAVSEEKSRAEAAENVLENAIAEEESQRIAADTKLTTDLATEVSRAETAEDQIAQDLADEQARAVAEEASLQAAISDEVAARTLAVSNEEIARIAADDALQGDIETEATTRALAISTEKSRAEAAELELQNALTAEQTARTAADSGLSGRLDIIEGTGEGSITKAKNDANTYTDTKIADLVDSAPNLLNTLKELSDALGGDHNFATTVASQIGTVQSNLTEEVTRALTEEAALADAISAAESSLSSAISSEESARITAISNEVSARSSADANLQSNIDAEAAARSAAVSAEQTRAEGVEASLQASITALEESIGQSLADQAAALEAARIEADSALLSELDAEGARAAAAEAALAQDIADEESARIAAVSAEAASRSSANSALQASIDAEVSARASAISSETSAREAADSALQGNIDSEEAARIAGDESTLASANQYTDSQVAALVDSAPDFLNTLKELSSALGGDKDFAVTINNSITELQQSIDDETARASAFESNLQTKIDNEGSRARLVEQELQDSINAIQAVVGVDITDAVSQFQSDIQQEIIDREAADAILNNLITQEETARINAVSQLNTSLNSEIIARQNAINLVNYAISNETATRISSDNAILEQLAVLQGTEDGSLAKVKQDSFTYTDTKVADLVGSAPDLLNTLTELAAALGNDQNFSTTVTNQIATVQNSVTTEKNRAIAVENTLSNSILSETNARQANIQTINQDINDLSQSLTLDLENEAISRQNAVNNIQTALNNEIQSRISNDLTTLDAANEYTDLKLSEILGSSPELLNTLQEINNAIGNDANFAVNINNQITTLQSLLNDEILRSETADSAFQSELEQLRLLYGKDLQPYKESFIITEQDLVNGYLQLSTRSVVLNSVIAWVDRLGIFEGVDYQLVSNADENWLRFVFSGNLIGSNEQSLEIDDVIHINYLIADGDELQQAVNEINAKIAKEVQDRADADDTINEKIDDVELRLTERIERGTMTPRYESFTLSSEDVNNGFIELNSDFVVDNSVNVTLNRVNLLDGIDFTVQKTLNNVYRLVFSNQIPVEVGEYIRINYMEAESNDLLVYPFYNNFVLDSNDISNNHVVLTKTNVMRESIQVFIDRIPLLQEVDFLISTNTQQQTILTFIGDFLPNNELALEIGENLRVNYLYRP